jgi:hypothetical protein
VSGFLLLLANPEFYSHLASWRVVIRTPDIEDGRGGGNYVDTKITMTMILVAIHEVDEMDLLSFAVICVFRHPLFLNFWLQFLCV